MDQKSAQNWRCQQPSGPALQFLDLIAFPTSQGTFPLGFFHLFSFHQQRVFVFEVGHDIYALSSTMIALSAASFWRQALLLFERLDERDAVSYGAAVAAAGEGRLWELAISWMEEMRKLDDFNGCFKKTVFLCFLVLGGGGSWGGWGGWFG